MESTSSDWVMYHETVRRLPLRERFRAASLAGCRALTTAAHEYVTMLGQGVSTRDMKKIAADAGIRFDSLEPFLRWVPHWEPDSGAGGVPLNALAYDEDDFFRFAAALEAKSFIVIGVFPKGSLEINEIIDCFGRLCTRAAREGLRCDLEFIPLGTIADLATAWRIVSAVNAPNSGIVFDFWHYNRGLPDDALLRRIPGRSITRVQFCDGTARLPPGRSIVEDMYLYREVPGEGEMRIREVVAILREIGALNNPGPEILSSAFDRLTAEDIAIRCRRGMEWALAA